MDKTININVLPQAYDVIFTINRLYAQRVKYCRMEQDWNILD